MNNSRKPAGFAPRVAPAKPLTEEEKKVKIMQFLQQKRESFSLNILCNLCKVLDKDASNENAKSLVDLSVEMADHLIEKLYPLPEEETDKSNN